MKSKDRLFRWLKRRPLSMDQQEHKHMTLNDLTVNFSHLDRKSLLSDWEWLIGTSKLPILLAACGNAFIQDTNDGSVHILDVGAGTLRQVASSLEDLRSLLSDKDFVVDNFAVQMIGDLRASGCALAAGEIYCFKQPPVMGGEYVLSNIEPADIEVHFSIAGQIHEQVAALPEGTTVNRVVVE